MNSIPIQPRIFYYGTPVALITTLNPDGTPNISPMSSSFALGDRVVLGMSEGGQGLDNLRRTGECVINLPSAAQHGAVERLAPTTGRAPVPEDKRAIGYRHVADKFGCAGLTPLRSEQVAPPRIAECPLQLEARLVAAHAGGPPPQFTILETCVLRTHAHRDIVVEGTQHIDTGRWQPLLYVFRHYFGTGPRLARTFKAEY
ncbi:MAG TPA: flavin reductase family protein [Nevskia sp.]|nr:flavin reductase family protein [Nevskia sp.]